LPLQLFQQLSACHGQSWRGKGGITKLDEGEDVCWRAACNNGLKVF